MVSLKDSIKYSLKTFFKFLHLVPIPLVIVILYFIFDSIYPSFYTVITSKLFESVAEQNIDIKSVGILLFSFLILFICKYSFEIIVDIPRSCYIYGKAKHLFNREIATKSSLLSYILFENTETYESMNRALDCISKNKLQKVLFSSLSVISIFIGTVSTLMVLFSFNYLLPIVVIISTIPFLILIKVKGVDFYENVWHQAKNRRKMDYLWGLFINKESIKELKTFKSEKYIYSKWEKARNEIYDQEYSMNKKEARTILLCSIFQFFGIIFGVILSISLLFTSKINAGQLIATINSFFLTQNMVKNCIISYSDLITASFFAKDYFEFMSLKEHKTKGLDISNFNTITFKNVYFTYPNSTAPVVKKISFDIKRGEKIVVVGENGSGKTTISKLLLGLYKPDKGIIMVDGSNLNDISEESYHNLCAFVPQNFNRFKMSVSDNITLSNIKNDIEINDLLRKVNLDELSSDLKLGREFGGRELSGGQWQKIAIARSVWKNSKLLILDEPTSAIDPIAEREILEEYLSISKGKTAIIVSHRVGLCTYADKIIVVKEGRINGVGSHNDLMASCPYYNYLYNEQKRWYL